MIYYASQKSYEFCFRKYFQLSHSNAIAIFSFLNLTHQVTFGSQDLIIGDSVIMIA